MNRNTLGSKNIRTMEYIGDDYWGRPVYKCIETGNLYKDITLGSDNPDLYCCSNDFDGEPGWPIKNDLEIHFKETVKQINQEDRFNYLLLDRLRSDCEYYLRSGNRNANNLWAKNEKEQIKKMKELYNSFSDNEKPEWLTYEQILQYEELLINKTGFLV
ncbi:LPD11 domain-containing protein [Bacillus sp. SCS-151]|uniref:LPD11 domain-containing protein n=1 Tax=Nanhaiella sioensis TaxID=3115293 RepID=UPI00397A1B2B